MPTTVTGIRDGHRITITITGPTGARTITRRHHPDCPCRTAPTPPSRVNR